MTLHFVVSYVSVVFFGFIGGVGLSLAQEE
jgi:hypothetical protein